MGTTLMTISNNIHYYHYYSFKLNHECLSLDLSPLLGIRMIELLALAANLVLTSLSARFPFTHAKFISSDTKLLSLHSEVWMLTCTSNTVIII